METGLAFWVLCTKTSSPDRYIVGEKYPVYYKISEKELYFSFLRPQQQSISFKCVPHLRWDLNDKKDLFRTWKRECRWTTYDFELTEKNQYSVNLI